MEVWLNTQVIEREEDKTKIMIVIRAVFFFSFDLNLPLPTSCRPSCFFSSIFMNCSEVNMRIEGELGLEWLHLHLSYGPYCIGDEDVDMWECEDVELWRYGDVRIWGSGDVEMWLCDYVKMRRCEDMRIWGCENVKIWECEDVEESMLWSMMEREVMQRVLVQVVF